MHSIKPYAPLDLRNQSAIAYLCKPAVIRKKVSKIEPTLCRLIEISCDSKQICQVNEIELPIAPEIKFSELKQ